MIGYLKGTPGDIQKISNNRVILTLEVNQVGYEIQIPPRLEKQLQAAGTPVQIFTHQQVREEQIVLYGFFSAAERDLFRLLVSVNGVGAQLAIALLDTLGLTDLVQAIVTSNTKILIKTPGVGSKTADRIALELKTKLAQWRHQAGIPVSASAPTSAIQEDVEMTLLALGYSTSEVIEAIDALSKDAVVSQSKDAEDWIKGAIAWLST